jgi:hypothetical protein
MDKTGMTMSMMAFAGNQDKAESMVQLLPAIVKLNISMECTNEWFMSNAYDQALCNKIQYDKESKTFMSPDEKMISYLLTEKCRAIK